MVYHCESILMGMRWCSFSGPQFLFRTPDGFDGAKECRFSVEVRYQNALYKCTSICVCHCPYDPVLCQEIEVIREDKTSVPVESILRKSYAANVTPIFIWFRIVEAIRALVFNQQIVLSVCVCVCVFMLNFGMEWKGTTHIHWRGRK